MTTLLEKQDRVEAQILDLPIDWRCGNGWLLGNSLLCHPNAAPILVQRLTTQAIGKQTSKVSKPIGNLAMSFQGIIPRGSHSKDIKFLLFFTI